MKIFNMKTIFIWSVFNFSEKSTKEPQEVKKGALRAFFFVFCERYTNFNVLAGYAGRVARRFADPPRYVFIAGSGTPTIVLIAGSETPTIVLIAGVGDPDN